MSVFDLQVFYEDFCSCSSGILTCSFCFLVVSLPGYNIRVMLKKESGSVPSDSIFFKYFKKY